MARKKTKISNQYWFKRRRYGWGWTPVTWQGWLVIATFILGLVSAARKLPDNEALATTDDYMKFFITAALAIGLLILVGFITAPRPKWRWGKKPTDNPDEDV